MRFCSPFSAAHSSTASSAAARRIDLVEADRLRDGRLSRDELLREVQGNAGDELELVALNLPLDDGCEPGVGFEQPPEVGLVEDQQLRGSDRLDAHGSLGAEDQRALAEEIPAPDVCDVAARAFFGLPDRA